MARLVIFGDSFAAERPEPHAWPKLLASKYEVPVKYYSFPATNIEFTSTKLYEYLETDYRDDDIIVLVLTSSARAPIVHDEYYPSWSPIYKFMLYDPDLISKMNMPALSKHMEEHLPYYETWQRFFNPAIHRSICYMIERTIASLPNKKLILSGFEDSDSQNQIVKMSCHPEGNLFAVSEQEYIHKVGIESFRGKDFRANHLSSDNHIILANYIYNCLEVEYTSLSDVVFEKGIYYA